MYLQGVMDKIVVKVLVEKEKITKGGIVLTGDAAQNQEPQVAGVVMSFGGKIPFDLNAGDILLFNRRAGMDIILDDIIYKVMKAEEVYGKMCDEKTNAEKLESELQSRWNNLVVDSAKVVDDEREVNNEKN